MSWAYEQVLRPLWFRLDAERAHEHGATVLRALGASGPVGRAVGAWRRAAGRPVEAFGVRFPNAIGLAAGFDKNAALWKGAAVLGFGHVEVGTVTPRRQPGNDRPRLFRLPEERAIINRMGFNNDGAEAIAARLRAAGADRSRPIVLGVNLGKGKATPLDRAFEDYVEGFRLLADFADYVTINVSSPNTPDLRLLQEQTRLGEILGAVQAANAERATRLGRAPLPVLVKIAPDLTWPQVDAVLGAATAHGLAGIIATNTTISRPGATALVREQGGLSGRPLRPLSLGMVRYVAHATAGRLPIVAAGGIEDGPSAARFLDAGACLVQVYTGFVYRGPSLVTEVASALGARRKPW